MTRTTLQKVSARLGLTPQQVEEFKNYHFRSDEGHGSGAGAEVGADIDMNQVTLDQFQIISDWYHYAILELLMLDSFEPSAKWIAKVLGISVPEVNAALERLERLEFIERKSNGKWINHSGNNTTMGNDFTAVAFRNLQKQILHKAITALETMPLEVREQSSLTLAMDSKFLPEAKALAKNFRKQLIQLQDRSKKKNQVYHLSISFYPLLDHQEKY